MKTIYVSWTYLETIEVEDDMTPDEIEELLDDMEPERLGMIVNGGIKMDRGTIEIKTARYINTDDVEKLTGKHWGDFEFAQMAANDAYQVMSCSDDYLEELYEDLEWETGKEGMTPEDFEDIFTLDNLYKIKKVRLKSLTLN